MTTTMGASTLPWFMIDGEGWARAGLSFTNNNRHPVIVSDRGVAAPIRGHGIDSKRQQLSELSSDYSIFTSKSEYMPTKCP
jgi:hypothetical protein